MDVISECDVHARTRARAHTHMNMVSLNNASTFADKTLRGAQQMLNQHIAIVVAPAQGGGSAAGERGRGPLATPIQHSASHASLRGRGPLPTPARSPAAHCSLRCHRPLPAPTRPSATRASRHLLRESARMHVSMCVSASDHVRACARESSEECSCSTAVCLSLVWCVSLPHQVLRM